MDEQQARDTPHGGETPIADPIVHLRPARTAGVPLDSIADHLRVSIIEAAEPGSERRSRRIHGVTISSDNVRVGDLWVGLPGALTHGAKYARAACERGAIAVLTDPAGAEILQRDGFTEAPVLVTEEPRHRLGEVCAFVFGTDQPEPQLLAVTGTNGKTSTAHMLRGVLEALEVESAVSSTVERWIGGERVVSGLTTPEATDTHALVAVMREREVEVGVFEVSAQALTRHRVDGLRFDVAGFTNLSHDHLDDYTDLEHYFAQKTELFTRRRARRAVISLESEWGRRLARLADIPVTTVGGAEDDADWRVEILGSDPSGTAFVLRDASGGRTLEARSPVPGAHMARNLALAIVMLLESGREFEQLAAALESGRRLPRIPGRTENVADDSAPAVFLDFGHSADAFRQTLEAVRAITSGRVLMVFGADGDRDSSKRADMAAAAVLGSDVLVITDHHPRFEDPASIRRALATSALQAKPEAQLHVVTPPPSAIRLAVRLARPGDSILWAGPGHQNYRDIRGVRTRYSAREEARAALREAGYAAKEP